MVAIKHYNVAQLPSVSQSGSLYFLNDGSQYLGKSDGKFLELTNVLFVDELPTFGQQRKLYMLSNNDNVQAFVWNGLEYKSISGTVSDNSDLEQLINTHSSNSSTQKHIEVVNTIPVNLADKGILFKVENGVLDAPTIAGIEALDARMSNFEIEINSDINTFKTEVRDEINAFQDIASDLTATTSDSINIIETKVDNHLNSEQYKHVEFVTELPSDLVDKGILFKIEGDTNTVPNTPLIETLLNRIEALEQRVQELEG